MSPIQLGLAVFAAVILLIVLFRLIMGLFFLFLGGVVLVVAFYWIKYNGLDGRSIAVLSGIFGAFSIISALKIAMHKKFKRHD